MAEEQTATETTSIETTGTQSDETKVEETKTVETTEAKTNGDATEDKTTETVEEAPAVDWRKAFSEKYKTQVDRFVSPDALIEGYRETRKALDASVQLPTDKSTEEEIAKFRKKAGIPEKAEDYKIEKPEWATDENFADFIGKAHSINMTEAQIQTTLEANAAYLAAAEEAEVNELKRHREAGTAALKKEMGKDFEANVQIAHRAAVHFMGTEGGDLLAMKLEDGGLLGDHPLFIKSWASIGRATSESAGLHMPFASSEEELEREWEDIEKLMIIEGKSLTKNAENQAKIKAWFDKKHGHAPADGRAV